MRYSNYELERRMRKMQTHSIPMMFLSVSLIIFILIGYLGTSHEEEAEIGKGCTATAWPQTCHNLPRTSHELNPEPDTTEPELTPQTTSCSVEKLAREAQTGSDDDDHTLDNATLVIYLWFSYVISMS